MGWTDRDRFPDSADPHDRFWRFVMPSLGNAIASQQYFLKKIEDGTASRQEIAFAAHAADCLTAKIQKERERLRTEIEINDGART